MKLKNPQLFFSTALGLKQVKRADKHGVLQTHWVSADFDAEGKIENEAVFDDYDLKLSSAREILYQIFNTSFLNNTTPVFTEESISTNFSLASEHMSQILIWLECLELNCLAQAIVDDDRDTVEAILKLKPELLLFQCSMIVTSENTGQRFGVHGNFLGLACRRKQIEMVKIMMPHFDALLKKLDVEQNAEEIKAICDIKNAGLSEWQKRTNAQGEIEVPAEYQAIIDDLIKLFCKENFKSGSDDFKKLSDELETEMESLYNRLIPDYKEEDISKRGIFNKQNQLDIELLLYVAYKEYDEQYNTLIEWQPNYAYGIRVLGILQKFLSPETSKIFCQGLYGVVVLGTPISPVAQGKIYRLCQDPIPFYSIADFSEKLGLGFEYLVDIKGWICHGDQSGDVIALPHCCKKMIADKDNTFEKLCASTSNAQTINQPTLSRSSNAK